jgi:hypothetical protein
MKLLRSDPSIRIARENLPRSFYAEHLMRDKCLPPDSLLLERQVRPL